MLERIRFRQWWQRPRPADQQQEERSVTFLELFYDLVYVVVIAELSHALAAHVSWPDIGIFAFLFAIVWWAWLNGTMYHDTHGNNDIRTRVFTFLQMMTVAAMAVFAHNAMGEGSIGFALSYAAFHLILTYLWWRTGVHDPAHRPLSNPYALTFLITSLLFIISVFVPTPWRYYLWGIGLLMDLIQPMLNLTVSNEAMQGQLRRTVFISASAVERFGLFTIIVLGEVIVGVVGGLTSHHHLTWLVGGIAALGMTIAFGLWWLYFDLVSHRLPKPRSTNILGWMLLHFPVTAGIAATGASILNVVEHAGEVIPDDVRWLLISAIAVVLASIALIMLLLDIPEAFRNFYRIGSTIAFCASLGVLLLGMAQLNTVPLLLTVLTLLLAPILYTIWIWLKVLDAQKVTT